MLFSCMWFGFGDCECGCFCFFFLCCCVGAFCFVLFSALYTAGCLVDTTRMLDFGGIREQRFIFLLILEGLDLAAGWWACMWRNSSCDNWEALLSLMLWSGRCCPSVELVGGVWWSCLSSLNTSKIMFY